MPKVEKIWSFNVPGTPWATSACCRMTFIFTIWGGWSRPHPGRFSPRERPGTICKGGNQGRSRWLQKISPPTGIRSPDRPSRNESLYRLSYPGPLLFLRVNNFLQSQISTDLTYNILFGCCSCGRTIVPQVCVCVLVRKRFAVTSEAPLHVQCPCAACI
jgi:hypothetical protein